MNYQQQLKKFITSQHLYTGVRVSGSVLIPSMILFHFGLLGSMIALPMGALFTSLSDNPGPVHHRWNGLKAGVVLNVLMIVFGSLTRHYPWLVTIELAVFGICLSLISVFGMRASSIGLMALIVFILNIDPSVPIPNVGLQALWLISGSAWYAVFSLLFYNIRPYRPIQQSLGECLIEIAGYLRSRALFYQADTNVPRLMGSLMIKQVEIHQHQEQLREMLFSTRKLVSESTQKGRSLMMIFIDSVDLLERIMTAQQDYSKLIKAFGDETILQRIQDNIYLLANSLDRAGLAIQSDEVATPSALEAEFQLTSDAFARLRKEKLTPETVESFIMLRHILYSLEDLTQRIKRIELYTAYRTVPQLEFDPALNLQTFKPHQEINFSIFWSNISLKSQSFRHALRVSIALVAGYLCSLFLQIGHGYWILLTIATIIKPAYSLSKQRNIQRLAGTFAGAALAFGILFLHPGNTVVLVVMVVSMLLAYSLLKLNYGVSSSFLTIFILLSFRFLHPLSLSELLVDRVIDTAIGSVIAFIVSYFVLPSWEVENIDRLVNAAKEKNRNYFEAVAAIYLGKPLSIMAYKVARKEAFVALANLSDNFQKMISEPKRQRANLESYHQFVSASHMLTSQIAALSAQAERFGQRYAREDFQPLINTIESLFDRPLKEQPAETPGLKSTQLKKKIDSLLKIRREELSGQREEAGMDTRKTLSELKTITDQFGLIAATLNDLNRIQQKLV